MATNPEPSSTDRLPVHDTWTLRRPGETVFWLSEGCPPWCTQRHSNREHFNDRYHAGEDLNTPLTALDPDKFDTETYLVRLVQVRLHQHYREFEPVVQFAHGDLAPEVIKLTLAEAEQVANDLLALVRQARSEATA